MTLALGLYAIYFLLVAVNGNSGKLFEQLQADGPAFLPWLVVAAVLGALYNYDRTRDFAGMFILLVAIAFFLKNYDALRNQFAPIYSKATSGGSQLNPPT